MGYLKPKSVIVILTQSSIGDKEVYTFPKGVAPRRNKME